MIYDIGLLFAILGSYALLDGTIASILAFCIAPIYLIATKRTRLLKYFVISIIITSIYLLIAHEYYNYGTNALMPFGLPMLPFFAWSIGLFAVRIIVEQIHAKPWKQFIIITALYWIVLLSMETIAYHLIGIRNIATAAYPGLPICDCIHAPQWMQVSYLLIGPGYLIICAVYDKIHNKIIGKIKIVRKNKLNKSQTKKISKTK